MIFMKKLIAIAVVFVLAVGVAFAQVADGISISGWGRAVFSPLVFIDAPRVNGDTPTGAESEIYAGSGITWGGPNPRVDFRVQGNSDYVGFGVHIQGEAMAVGDFANIWAKPLGSDVLKITVGRLIEDTLRGKVDDLNAGFGDFVLPGGIDAEDVIFSRFGTHGEAKGNGGDWGSFLISSQPVEGLFLGLMVPGQLWNWGGPTSGTFVQQAYRYLQVGAGYNIDGIGHIRAQYIGGWVGTTDPVSSYSQKYYEDDKRARIEAAFALTKVENLLVDLGVKFGLKEAVKGDTTYNDGVTIGLGATYNSGDFGIGAHASINGINYYSRVYDDSNDKNLDSVVTIIRLVPTYNLGAVTLGLDAAFAFGTAPKDYNGDAVQFNDRDASGYQFGVGAYVSKDLGSGNFKAGLSYTLPEYIAGKANGSGIFRIPIILQYAFF
jgi:hypothetical protein